MKKILALLLLLIPIISNARSVTGYNSWTPNKGSRSNYVVSLMCNDAGCNGGSCNMGKHQRNFEIIDSDCRDFADKKMYNSYDQDYEIKKKYIEKCMKRKIRNNPTKFWSCSNTSILTYEVGIDRNDSMNGNTISFNVCPNDPIKHKNFKKLSKKDLQGLIEQLNDEYAKEICN